MTTTEKKYFSEKDMQDFERDGYVIVRGMYSAEEMEQISKWVEDISNAPPVVGGMMPYYDQSKIDPAQKVLSRIEKFADHHTGLHDLCYEERMTHRVEELLNDKVLLFKEKVNFKRPGGLGFEAHQDIQPGWDSYCDYFISVLLTVDDSTLENGCLELSAGHHKRGLLGERWKPLTPEQLRGVEFVKFPTSPGDVVFFDCFVPHRSEPNLTNKQRRNIYLTYNRAKDGDFREKYFADKRKSFPPEHEREAGKEYAYKV